MAPGRPVSKWNEWMGFVSPSDLASFPTQLIFFHSYLSLPTSPNADHHRFTTIVTHRCCRDHHHPITVADSYFPTPILFLNFLSLLNDVTELRLSPIHLHHPRPSLIHHRLAFPEPNNSILRKIAKLEDPAQYSRLGHVPRRADLDMNQHVNNVSYRTCLRSYR
ncbi:hypothetical protein DVH24_028576 [Malus domestica]|uniref:Acyl-ACP thioesterase-like C-terminal domain-containing protein n=1 Tax=Malus domestica TaxID=3750 RepID=A0A498IUY5_MALDO|nr:hypothetical protein DVH24_028576 [Malus domestica]